MTKFPTGTQHSKIVHHVTIKNRLHAMPKIVLNMYFIFEVPNSMLDVINHMLIIGFISKMNIFKSSLCLKHTYVSKTTFLTCF